MEIRDFFERMRTGVSEGALGRSESSSFLIWFLDNFFRLEYQDAVDSVTDHPNDKGIDGLFVDDEDEIIYLFQSKYSPSDNQHQGDNDIRNFIGAREWFVSEDSVNNLLNSTANRDLKSLISSKNVKEKTGYKLISVFVTNKLFNTHANEYIETVRDIEAYDRDKLFSKFTYFADEENNFPLTDLFLSNHSRICYSMPDETVANVYSIKAKELTRLCGIQDRTLFYKNVRYSVGNTRVNKSIKNTINDLSEHNNFFLYHNGITIICEDLIEDFGNNKISISNYAVVNGCQSMLSFYENRDRLSENLFVPVKIIKINLNSNRVKKITYFANNQNSISLKDLRSNDSVQKTLQREFEELFNGSVLYIRKKGEINNGVEYIDKDFASQLIEAVYLKNPQGTHLKQKLFGEKYSIVFSRSINAGKIYLASLIYRVVKDNAHLLEIEKIRNYGLSLFFFAHIISSIMEEDEKGKIILEDPNQYVTIEKETLLRSLLKIWELITPDINFEIQEFINDDDGFFDYKNVFKNNNFIQQMTGKIKSDYIRLTRRSLDNSFSSIYNASIFNN